MNETTVRTVLVTGSTDGIGKETAAQLAELGMHVLVHGRNEPRGQAALDDVRTRTGSDKLDLVVADLTSQRQIRELAADIGRRFDRLDVLVNNAGVYMARRVLTEDGMETTLAVNYLAPFLLTHLLLDLLRSSSPARIISLASVAHFSVDVVDFTNLQGERYYDGYDAYALSKAAVVLFTYELAERLGDAGVTANCLHPGVINTKLLRAGFPGSRGAPVAKGAATPAYLATSPAVEGVTGGYWDDKKPVRSSPQTYDRHTRHRLWEVSERLVGLVAARRATSV